MQKKITLDTSRIDALPASSFTDALANSRQYFDELITRASNQVAALRCAKIAELAGRSLSHVREQYADDIAKFVAQGMAARVEDVLCNAVREQVSNALEVFVASEQGKSL